MQDLFLQSEQNEPRVKVRTENKEVSGKGRCEHPRRVGQRSVARAPKLHRAPHAGHVWQNYQFQFPAFRSGDGEVHSTRSISFHAIVFRRSPKLNGVRHVEITTLGSPSPANVAPVTPV